MIRSLVGILGAVAVAAALVGPAAAQSDQRCFPETGQCISGSIRAYWENNGGLPVFGYPIAPQRIETIEGSWSGPTQWFERDRLEDHANEGKGILAGRLGVASFQQTYGSDWQQLPPDGTGQAGCTFFSQTSFNLCEPFRSYWQNNGGLERFGYPITRQRQEVIEGKSYTVQYFERRRMEYHPENADTPYAVLLGLLGRQVYGANGGPVVNPTTPGDLAVDIQQAVLNATYSALNTNYPGGKFAIGLLGATDTHAAAFANVFGRPAMYVYLNKTRTGWQVDSMYTKIDLSVLQAKGVPAELLPNTAVADVALLAVNQLQDPRGGGIGAYVTRPRISGNYARFWVRPFDVNALDPSSQFYKRENGSWKFLTAGSAFPDDDLRALGVPQDLWSYGDNVQAPPSS